MKRKFTFLLLLLSFLLCNNTLSAQCTDFVEGPFPVPELPIPFCGEDVCGVPYTIFAPVQTSSAIQLSGLVAGNTYQFSLCPFILAPINLELILVDSQNPNIPIQVSNDCAIQFIAPFNGNYLMIINEVGQPCPNLAPQPVAEGFEIDSTCPNSCPLTCGGINRAKASALLLSPASGVPTDLLTNVWMPLEDFGFGFGREGLLPAGTQINPAGPSDCGSLTLGSDAYFFWLDDLPNAKFVHSTRFVLVDANTCDATVGNGGITVSNQEWWPIITLPDLSTFEYFSGDLVSPEPPGVTNPDGLIDGDVPDSLSPAPDPAPNTSSNTSAGLVVTGAKGTGFKNDVKNGVKNLQDQFDVDSDSIRTLGDTAITIQQFCDAIDDLAKSDASKFHIVMSSHGNTGVFAFKDGNITKEALCTKFKKLAKKGKPICLTIDACKSGSLLDADKWGFPPGSVIITAANSFRLSFLLSGFKVLNSDGTLGADEITESAYLHAHNTCLKDPLADVDKKNGVDNCEAYKWVKKVKPCYAKSIGPVKIGSYTIERIVLYPAGTSDVPDTTIIVPNSCGGNDTLFIKGNKIFPHNPMPQIQKVGEAPKAQGTNAQNKTGASQNSYSGLYQGDLSGASGQAFFSDIDGNLGTAWANSITTSYDPITDLTVVTWPALGPPASDLDFIYFQLEAPPLVPIIPVQQFWGPQGVFPQQPPILEPELYIVGEGLDLNVVLVNRGLDAGGLGELIEFNLKLRVSDVPLPLPQLVPDDPFFLPPPILSQAGSLPPDGLIEIPMPVPDLIEPGQFLIAELCTKFPSEIAFSTIQISQWEEPLLPPLCLDIDIEILPLDLVGVDPVYINTSGKITVNGADIQSTVKSVLNSGTQIQILPPSTISSEAHLFIYGCDGSTLPPNIVESEEENRAVEEIESFIAVTKSAAPSNTTLKIVPNPFYETVILQYELQESSTISVAIYDLNGKQLLHILDHVSMEKGVHNTTLDLSNLAEGVYFAVLRTNGLLQPIKLVKARN